MFGSLAYWWAISRIKNWQKLGSVWQKLGSVWQNAYCYWRILAVFGSQAGGIEKSITLLFLKGYWQLPHLFIQPNCQNFNFLSFLLFLRFPESGKMWHSKLFLFLEEGSKRRRGGQLVRVEIWMPAGTCISGVDPVSEIVRVWSGFLCQLNRLFPYPALQYRRRWWYGPVTIGNYLDVAGSIGR